MPRGTSERVPMHRRPGRLHHRGPLQRIPVVHLRRVHHSGPDHRPAGAVHHHLDSAGAVHPKPELIGPFHLGANAHEKKPGSMPGLFVVDGPRRAGRSVAVGVAFVGAVHRNTDVVGLLLAQDLQIHTDLLEVESGHLLIEVLRQACTPCSRSWCCSSRARSGRSSGW